MKKIMFLVLVLSLFLISGCAEQTENEEDSSEPADVNVQGPDDNTGDDSDLTEPIEIVGEKEPESAEAAQLRETIADRKNKFAMTTSSIKIERRNQETLFFGIMNQRDEASDFTFEFSCYEAMHSAAKPETDIIFEYTDEIENLEKDIIEVFPLTIKLTEDAVPTQYKCRAVIGPENYATMAFGITVLNP
ncbi:MAG: hypothetical protein PHV16_03035 [Candidatus Nanoarchaeia archaeon]|nr:hypothetical protein [Candidatus Nanoarchaeia archaeon]